MVALNKLVTNFRDGGGGGYKMGGGGKLYPYKKGEVITSFSRAEGGHKMFWGSFYAVA